MEHVSTFYIDPEHHNAQCHRWMERQTDDSIVPIADHTVLKSNNNNNKTVIIILQ